MIDQGCFKKETKSVGNTNQERNELGDSLKKNEPKYTTKKINAFIAMSLKTMFACLNWLVRLLVFTILFLLRLFALL